jgi:hypothetical protein
MVNENSIFTRPLDELAPAELHQRGIERLGQSLGSTGDPGVAMAEGVQAMAFLFASLSAANLAGMAGAHRAGPDERTLGDRVHSG